MDTVTYLKPNLIPVQNCFVNLPWSFLPAYLSRTESNGTNALIVELSWETLDGYVQTVNCGWIGGVSKSVEHVGIPSEFARCIGLTQILTEMSISHIGVRLAEPIPVARQLEIEPISADDWELIQLLTDEMESKILQQIAVFNNRQTVPVFTSQSLVVFIRPLLNNHDESVRITAETELLVIPKMRKTNVEDAVHFAASQSLLVEDSDDSTLRSLANNGTTCYVHPDTFIQIQGVLPSPISADSVIKLPIVAVWGMIEGNDHSDSETRENRSKHPKKTIGVGFLKCTTHLYPGRILLSKALQTHLFPGSIEDSVQLSLLRLPPLVPSSVRINATVLPRDTSQECELQGDLKQLIMKYLQLQSSSWALWDSFTFDLALPQVSRCSVQFQLEFNEIVDTDSALSNTEAAEPLRSLQNYTLLSQVIDQIAQNMHIDILPQNLIRSDTLNRASISLEIYPIWELSRATSAYNTLSEKLLKIFDYRHGFARVQLRVSLPTCSLLHGRSGVGKTIICRTLAKDLSVLNNARVYSLFQDCRELKGLKMKSVLEKLSELWDSGRVRAPSLIILDNLDAIAPNESDSSAVVNEQSREIASHIRDLMQQQIDKVSESVFQLEVLIEKERKRIARSDSPIRGKERLMQSIGCALLSKTIACLGVSLSGTSIHQSLIGHGFFESTVRQPKPDQQIRENFLKGMLLSHGTSALQVYNPTKDSLKLDIDFSAAAIHTEGYNFRDLSTACTRAIHRTITQHANAFGAENSIDATMTLTTDIFKAAIKEFQASSQPANMFKSSVKWTDVGGLLSVRSILRETLEYPVRYSKLYENVPIRLPAGLLLFGPPGCGKTLIASAVAAECGLSFISVKGPEVLSKYIGASEQAIRDLFGQAASAAPCILFLDEIDSITPRRGSENTGVTDRIVNQLLTFLDGVESRKGIYILGATSRPDMIDPAILRPGRLDKSLYCGFPTENERLDILRVCSQHLPLSEEATDFLEVLAAQPQSSNCTGADLNAILSTAHLELVHEKIRCKFKDDLTMTRIERRHLEAAALKTKPSIDSRKRIEYEALYRNFSRSKFTDLSLSDVDASASIAKLQKTDIHPQRIALA